MKAWEQLDTAAAEHLANDPRFTAMLPPAFLRCPVVDCHMGPAAHVYVATLRAPDGSQRTVAGCVKHIVDRCAAALSAVRVEPHDDY